MKRPIPTDAELRQLIATGTGHDYIALSARDRARVCMLLEKRVGAKEAGYYLDFLGAFYFRARDENPALLSTPIHEAAAVAAAAP